MKSVKDAEVWTHQVQLLKNKDPLVRSTAAANLARLGPEARFAIGLLRERLLDSDPAVRWRAAAALGEIGPAAVEELMGALALPDSRVRREIVWALGKIGPEAGPAVMALARALGDRDATVRKGAARSLGLLGRISRPAIPFLIEALNNTDLLFCRLAAWALGKIGPPAVAALVTALSHSDKFVRREAAWALGQMGSDARAAIPKLTAILRSYHPVVAPALAGKPKPAVSRQGPKIPCPADTEVVSPVVAESPDRTTHLSFTESDPPVRAHAARALGQIGPEARSAIPALTAALADANDEVAAAAALALDQLQGHASTHRSLKAAC